MAGPWLYTISGKSEHTFDIGNESIPVNVDSYRKLVENGSIVKDVYWGVSQRWKDVQVGDELFIYTGDRNIGIIGFATIRAIDVENKCLLPDFDIAKCRELLKNPIPADTVRSWKLSLRRNVIDLSTVEKQFRALLEKAFSRFRVIHVEERDLTDTEIDEAIEGGTLSIGDIPTETPLAIVRQRRGQDRLRYLALKHYEKRCAVCDVSDERLLVASHVLGWAESAGDRGKLANVICLCRMHDALFEAGYWSLNDCLEIVRKKDISSQTIRLLLDGISGFRMPRQFPPDKRFLREHRKRVAPYEHL